MCDLLVTVYRVGGKWIRVVWFDKEDDKDHKLQERAAINFDNEPTIRADVAKVPCVFNVRVDALCTLPFLLDYHKHINEKVAVTKWIPQVG